MALNQDIIAPSNPLASYTPQSVPALESSVPAAPQAVAPVLGTVDNDSTVEGRITGLLSKDSLYMQQAGAQANKAMNTRGLANSSMAVGAVEDARIKNAMPIATQDANTYGKQQLMNQDAQNKFKVAEQSFDFQQNLNKQNIDAQTAQMAQKFGYDTNLAGQDNVNKQALVSLQADLQSQLDASNSLSAQDRDRLAAQLDLVQSQVTHQQDIEKAYLQSIANIRQSASSDAALIGRTEGLTSAQQSTAMNKVYDQATIDTNFMQSVFSTPQSWNW